MFIEIHPQIQRYDMYIDFNYNFIKDLCCLNSLLLGTNLGISLYFVFLEVKETHKSLKITISLK